MSSDNPSGITAQEAFDALFYRIEKHCDDLKMQSAEASLVGQFTKIRRLAERYSDWLIYQKKLEKFQSQWLKLSQIPKQASKPESKKAEPPVNKVKEGKLSVQLNGNIIDMGNNTDTFITTLTQIGLEQVALLDKKIDNIPLLELAVSEETDTLSTQNWQIHTDMDDYTKYKILNSITRRLNLDLSVELK